MSEQTQPFILRYPCPALFVGGQVGDEMQRLETEDPNDRGGLHRRDLGKMAVAAGAVWAVPQMVLVPAASAQGSRCPEPLPVFDGQSISVGSTTALVAAPANTTDLNDATPINLTPPPGPFPQSQVFYETGPVLLGQPTLIDAPAAPNTSYTVPGPLGFLPAGIPIFSVFVNARRSPQVLSRGVFFGDVSVAAPWVIVGIAFRTRQLRDTSAAGFDAPGTTYIHNTEAGHGLEDSTWPEAWPQFEGPAGQTGDRDRVTVTADRRGLSWELLTGLQYSDNFRFFVTHQDCLL